MFNFPKRLHFPAFALVALASPALAEAPDPEPIIVTGKALDLPAGQGAFASDVLSAEQVRMLASGRIEDLLGRAPGVQQFRRSDSRSSNPSAQGITLRGLGGNASSRTLVLLDGVPLVDPFFGYVPLSALPPERLDSVRVLRGGGAGGFAAGAVAGTIDLASPGRIRWACCLPRPWSMTGARASCRHRLPRASAAALPWSRGGGTGGRGSGPRRKASGFRLRSARGLIPGRRPARRRAADTGH